MIDLRRNQKGQFVIEAVLLTVLLLSLFGFVTSQLKQRGMLKKLMQTPFLHYSGMAENGVWGDPAQTRSKHPNLKFRHLSQETTP